MGYISLRTARDVGLLLREERKRAGLDQATLARRIGVSRKWVIDAEHGNPGASLGSILRALDAVGVHLGVAASSTEESRTVVPAIDIDAIVEAARKRKR